MVMWKFIKAVLCKHSLHTQTAHIEISFEQHAHEIPVKCVYLRNTGKADQCCEDALTSASFRWFVSAPRMKYDFKCDPIQSTDPIARLNLLNTIQHLWRRILMIVIYNHEVSFPEK